MERTDYKNVFVAVCDILGFKDLVMNNDFEETKEIINEFVYYLEKSVTGGKDRASELEGRKEKTSDTDEIKLNFNLFADTVVLWTDDEKVESFFYLLIGTKNLLLSSIKFGLPLRGAISQGDIRVNPLKIESNFNNFENFIFGKPLIKASIFEKDQLWSGCIIDPELANSNELAIRIIFQDKLQRDLYLFYNVPLKSKGCRNMLTVNWVWWGEDDIQSVDKIKTAFSAHNKSIKDDSVNVKLENTISYYKHSKIMFEKFKNR